MRKMILTISHENPDLNAVSDWIRDQKTDCVVSAYPVDGNNSQRNYYWAGIVRPIARQIGDDEQSVHQALKLRLLPPKIVWGLQVPMSIKDLTPEEFSQYIGQAKLFALNFLRINLL